jgi:uncharacterized Ntn-hydrolase superfamily protein
MPRVTYSIVAWDEPGGELGVAVQSCAFNTGAACAWALPGVAVVATQSFTGRQYGTDGLALMRDGRQPEEALTEVLAEDERRIRRSPRARRVAARGPHGARDTIAPCPTRSTSPVILRLTP